MSHFGRPRFDRRSRIAEMGRTCRGAMRQPNRNRNSYVDAGIGWILSVGNPNGPFQRSAVAEFRVSLIQGQVKSSDRMGRY